MSEVDYTYVNSNELAERCVERVQFEGGHRLYPFDIETTGLDPLTDSILLIQFKLVSTDETFLINCRKVDYHHQLNIMKALWNNGGSSLLGHNLKFDLKFLMAKYPEIYFHNVWDTYITDIMITNGVSMKPPSLKELIEKYINVKIDKTDQKSFVDWSGDEFPEHMLEYAARDVSYLWTIYTKQKTQIQLTGQDQIHKVECRATPAFAKLELDGIFINKARWKQNEAYAKERRARAIDVLNSTAVTYLGGNLFGEPPILWSSSAQVLNFLRMVVDPSIPDTNEKTLIKYKHPIIDDLLNFREWEKLITSYGSGILAEINQFDGRVHPTFNQIGAVTGRTSCRNPNVQQVPKVSRKDENGVKHMIYREAVTPQIPGGKILGADYSSFELRILQDLAKDVNFAKCFEPGADPHSIVASFIFGVPVSKKENAELRDVGKSVNFGISYGMGPKKLSEKMEENLKRKVSVQEAAGVLELFFKKFPRIKAFQEYFIESTFQKLAMVNPYDGRRVNIGGKDLSNPKIVAALKNEIKNFPCQSTNASVIKIAMANLQLFLFKTKSTARIINTIHDELLIECVSEEEAKTLAPVLTGAMENAAMFYLSSVGCPVDATITDYWSKG